MLKKSKNNSGLSISVLSLCIALCALIGIGFIVHKEVTKNSFASLIESVDIPQARLSTGSKISTSLYVDGLPKPDQLVPLSDQFSYPVLKGIKIDSSDPFKLDFIIDPQDKKEVSDQEIARLLNYFLAALTIPEAELWVNLSPYEKDQITSDKLSVTDLGKDMLSQDYLLKQLVSSLTYPESALGSKYWSKVYQRVQEQFGTSNIPVSTFNKIWIIPESADIYENGNVALITGARLKAMHEVDWLASGRSQLGTGPSLTDQSLSNKLQNGRLLSSSDLIGGSNQEITNQLASEALKDIILPAINQEINSGENFAQLRQMYHSFILALWFKQTLKESIYKHYIDQSKIEGIDLEDTTTKDKIFNLYVEAYKKGVYNYIKKEVDPATNKQIKRQYTTGGVGFPTITLNRHKNAAVAKQFNAADLISLTTKAGAASPVQVIMRDEQQYMETFEGSPTGKELIFEWGEGKVRDLGYELLKQLRYYDYDDFLDDLGIVGKTKRQVRADFYVFAQILRYKDTGLINGLRSSISSPAQVIMQEEQFYMEKFEDSREGKELIAEWRLGKVRDLGYKLLRQLRYYKANAPLDHLGIVNNKNDLLLNYSSFAATLKAMDSGLIKLRPSASSPVRHSKSRMLSPKRFSLPGIDESIGVKELVYGINKLQRLIDELPRYNDASIIPWEGQGIVSKLMRSFMFQSQQYSIEIRRIKGTKYWMIGSMSVHDVSVALRSLEKRAQKASASSPVEGGGQIIVSIPDTSTKLQYSLTVRGIANIIAQMSRRSKYLSGRPLIKGENKEVSAIMSHAARQYRFSIMEDKIYFARHNQQAWRISADGFDAFYAWLDRQLKLFNEDVEYSKVYNDLILEETSVSSPIKGVEVRDQGLYIDSADGYYALKHASGVIDRMLAELRKKNAGTFGSTIKSSEGLVDTLMHKLRTLDWVEISRIGPHGSYRGLWSVKSSFVNALDKKFTDLSRQIKAKIAAQAGVSSPVLIDVAVEIELDQEGSYGSGRSIHNVAILFGEDEAEFTLAENFWGQDGGKYSNRRIQELAKAMEQLISNAKDPNQVVGFLEVAESYKVIKQQFNAKKGLSVERMYEILQKGLKQYIKQNGASSPVKKNGLDSLSIDQLVNIFFETKGGKRLIGQMGQSRVEELARELLDQLKSEKPNFRIPGHEYLRKKNVMDWDNPRGRVYFLEILTKRDNGELPRPEAQIVIPGSDIRFNYQEVKDMLDEILLIINDKTSLRSEDVRIVRGSGREYEIKRALLERAIKALGRVAWEEVLMGTWRIIGAYVNDFRGWFNRQEQILNGKEVPLRNKHDLSIRRLGSSSPARGGIALETTSNFKMNTTRGLVEVSIPMVDVIAFQGMKGMELEVVSKRVGISIEKFLE